MERRLTSLLGNGQRLDGGAMFGNAPRAVWERWMPPDARHRVTLACRCLLVEEVTGGRVARRILCETGIGAFFPPTLRERFGVTEARHVLVDELARHGLSPVDIDVVVLSHLHFDHAGGLLTPFREDAPHALLFPNATFVVSRPAWERATAPHARDRASFIPELQDLLEASGRLEVFDGTGSVTLGTAYRFHLSEGHTPGLALLEIPMPSGPVVFAGDLVPGTPWVHAPITMGYDRFPERLIDEKIVLLQELVDRRGRLFYTHDPAVALSRISRDDDGRFRAVEPEATLEHATA